MEVEYSWTSYDILNFIRARSKYKFDISSPVSSDYIYQQILHEIGLSNSVSVKSASNLWECLVNKYKELSQPALEPEDALPPTWEYFGAMQAAFLSQTTSCLLEVEATGIDLQHQPHETIDEEAARLEEVFRSTNIVETLVPQEEGHRANGEEECVDNVMEDIISGDEEEEEQDQEEQEGLCNQVDSKTNLKSGISDYLIVDDIWTEAKILQFISLRGEKEADILKLGKKKGFSQILEQLGLANAVTVSIAQRKWSALVHKYFSVKFKNDTERETFSQGGNLENGIQCTENEKTVPWIFLPEMRRVMENILKTSPDAGINSRKSPDFIWTIEISRKFIELRMEKHHEICLKGHNAVYQEILDELGISDRVTLLNARKKWNYLIKRYQDEKTASGGRTWPLMPDMKSVMGRFRGLNSVKLKSRASPEFLWPNELTRKFILLRSKRHADFVEGGTQQIYCEIMDDLGLGHILTSYHLRKKWNYLVAKYREIVCTKVSEGGWGPAPHTWPFFEDMKRALEAIPEGLGNPAKVVRSNAENVWTKETIVKLIHLKGQKSATENLTKKVSVVFGEIVEEMGLGNQISSIQARKKWNYLYNKYLDLCHPDVDEFDRQSWPFFCVMQEVVGALPVSEIMKKKRIGTGLEDGAEDSVGTDTKRPRIYVCFLCGKNGKFLNEFFMFEANQHLLHTQKPVLDILSHLVGKKVSNAESTTSLCTRCTNIVNEADSVMAHHEKLKTESHKLYQHMLNQLKEEEEEECSSITDVPDQGDETLENDEEDIDTIQIALSEEPVVETEEALAEEDTQGITYSKRGRKRTSTKVKKDAVQIPIKTEQDDDFNAEANFDFDDDSEREERRKIKLKGRARGRSIRGRRKRGRPPTRSTLIGRGLDGEYPPSNKRKSIPFKGTKIYRCTECVSEFKRYTELVTHRKAAHTVFDENTLEVQETVLENGIITYFNKGKANNVTTSHTCKECQKKFLRKDDLWYHQDLAHTNGKGRTKTAFKNRSYDCEECGEKFLFKYKLKLHINSKHLNDAGTNANDFTCGVCGCKLGSLPGLTFHMRKHHDKSLSYRRHTEYLCSDCGFMAPSNKKLIEHQGSHCGSATKPKVQCEICGKTVLKVSLKMHKIKMHTDFKEQCDRCGERYATKTDLLRHINVVHLGILLYICKSCGERFPTSDSLRYHRVKVHEKPSFFCQVCGRSYRRVGELNTHMKRAHDTRKKAEVCQYCNKEYFDRSGLRNHLINKHNVPQEMTYSETYLRKKRVDGLPLAKHMEKQGRLLISNNLQQDAPETSSFITQPQMPQQEIHQAQHQLHNPQPHGVVVPQSEHHSTVIGASSHSHMRVAMDETVQAARNLAAYHEAHNPVVDDSVVVTEITAGPQTEPPGQPTVLVQTLNVPPSGIIPHPQVAHMQPSGPSVVMQQHPMHHQMPHPANVRLNVYYQMNVHHPGQSHINM